MQVFDRIDPRDLERREWHLWVLVLATLLVFTCAIVLLMYPSVFLTPLIVSGLELRRVFFGFCLLSALLLAYLANRQIVLARARRQVFRNQEAQIQAQSDLAVTLLGSLPDLPLFQARLRAEFQRAALGRQPFSLVLASVQASNDPSAADKRVISLIVGAFKRKLRRDDLIYLLAPQVFCILLPGVTCANAERVRERMKQALTNARTSSEFTFETQMLNYPEQTKSLSGFEEAVRSFAGIRIETQAGRGVRTGDSAVGPPQP